ncbi:MAG: SPASM domain-containing protein [Chloroflexota bacterium]
MTPCMLPHATLGNVGGQGVTRIWEQSPLLAQLRSRELKGECGRCPQRATCAGCRGRAYEETGDVRASDPGCWSVSTAGGREEVDERQEARQYS